MGEVRVVVPDGDGRIDKTDVIVLAGGLGTRLRSVVNDVPKVLATIGGKPFLDLVLAHLDRYPFIDRVVIASGYMAEEIYWCYGSGHPYRFEMVFSEERMPLGTGGAIKKALKRTVTDTVFALNGDSYVQVDLEAVRQRHRERGAAMTMVLKEVEDAYRFGSVSMDAQMRVTAFEEKGRRDRGTINAGVYLFDRAIFDGLEEGVNLSMERDLLPSFLKKGVYGYETRGRFIDIGTPESYAMAEAYLGGQQCQ